MTESTRAYFAAERKMLQAALKRGDTRSAGQILDDATALVNDLYERMPVPPPTRDYTAMPKK